MAFLAGLMALISTTPLATRRKGIGGAILAGAGNLGPPYAAPAGYRWEQQPKPVYAWKEVEVVDQVEVPNMVTRQVQVGAKTIYEELPVYKTITIDEGHWQTRTVTRYRQETYVKGYITRTKRIREPDGRWLAMPVRVPVYGTRSVPYTETERRWIPRPVQKQILVNVKQIPVQVPIYEERLVQDGTRIEEVTRTERKRIQVGTEVEWVVVEDRDPPPPDEEPVKWIGVILGTMLTLVGAGMAIIGLAVMPEDPGAAFVALAGVLLAVLGAEVVTQSLGSARPEWWPEHILNIDGVPPEKNR